MFLNIEKITKQEEKLGDENHSLVINNRVKKAMVFYY